MYPIPGRVRARRAPVRDRRAPCRVAAPLYAYRFLDDFVLLYPVYALLFSDTGLSVWEISSLFAVWSGASMLMEVPAGVWADAVSRRLPLVAGPLLTAVAFTLWVSAPSYWVFAFGFLLWGIKGALGSGALEALVYEELDRAGVPDRYAAVMGRGTAAGMVGVVLAMAVAGPVMAAGGYPAVGAASVAACVLSAAVAAVLPEHRGARRAAGDAPEPGWTATLRAGLAQARRSRPVRSGVVLVALVTGVWGALDEYVPLLVRDTGVPGAGVPLLLLLVWSCATAGGLLAGYGERLRTAGFAALLVVAAVALAAGALIGRPPGVVLVAASFAAFQLASVVADARLQHSITGPARATVTSLAGMSTDVATLAVYGGYGVLAGLIGHGGAFAVLALPYAAVAVWLLRSAARAGSG
ncbi:MAG TPA: MFS transporter [Pilimelia sp.]|nr:MFS transporter [Pilimelia sp.]